MNMDSTFLGILDNHVHAIRCATDNKSANDALLITVKLLIDEIQYSSEILSDYDKMGIRKLFAAFGNVAQTACDFYLNSKEHLDPVALNGEIGRKLEMATNEVVRVNELLEAIEKTNSDWLEKERELEKNNTDVLEKERELDALSDRYKKREQRVSELRQVMETVTPEVLEELEREADELDEIIRVNRKIKSELDDRINEYKAVEQALSETIAQVNSEKSNIEENVVQTIKTRIETLREICATQSEDISRFQTEIDSYIEQYSRFEDDFAEIKALHSNYELHLGENSRVSNELKKYGILSIRSFSDEIMRLETDVGRELARYDELIRGIIKEQELIKEALISKSKPGQSADRQGAST